MWACICVNIYMCICVNIYTFMCRPCACVYLCVGIYVSIFMCWTYCQVTPRPFIHFRFLVKDPRISPFLFQPCFTYFLPSVSGFTLAFCNAAQRVALKKGHDPLCLVSSCDASGRALTGQETCCADKTPATRRFCDQDMKPDRSPASCTWLWRKGGDKRTCDELTTSYHTELFLTILITKIKTGYGWVSEKRKTLKGLLTDLVKRHTCLQLGILKKPNTFSL